MLSEGQNLQDCDYVINFDIHWNPVRVIQRMGRIDRFGIAQCRRLWPELLAQRKHQPLSGFADTYRGRMAQMKLAGAEVDERFSEGVRRKTQDDGLDRDQIERMMRQMETTWEEIEVGEETFGFDDLSLESFRQDLTAQMQTERLKFESMPKGVFSGCLKISEHCPEEGIVALVAYPARPPRVKQHTYQSMELLYLNSKGEAVRHNQQEVLQALAKHKDCPRYVPEGLDQGVSAILHRLTGMMKVLAPTRGWRAKKEENEDSVPSSALFPSLAGQYLAGRQEHTQSNQIWRHDSRSLPISPLRFTSLAVRTLINASDYPPIFNR